MNRNLNSRQYQRCPELFFGPEDSRIFPNPEFGFSGFGSGQVFAVSGSFGIRENFPGELQSKRKLKIHFVLKNLEAKARYSDDDDCYFVAISAVGSHSVALRINFMSN